MSVYSKITLLGMYNYDDTLFEFVSFPDGIDKETFIDTLMLSYGEMRVIYSDYDFLKFAIGAWSRKWHDSIIKIYNAIIQEYNPIHNFDRNEVYTDHRVNDTRNGGSDRVNTTTEMESTNTSATENTVSAYNVDTYQPDNKNDIKSDSSNSSNSTNTTNYGATTNTNEDITHEGHLYGNIGITKSQDMVIDEITLRRNNNIYQILSDMFKNELLIMIY